MVVNESNTAEQLPQPDNSNTDSNLPKFSIGDRVMLSDLDMPKECFYVEEVVRNTIPISYVLKGENNDTRVCSDLELLEYNHITNDDETNDFLEVVNNPQFTESIQEEIKNMNYVPIKRAVLKFQTQFPQDKSSITLIKRYLHKNYKVELDIRKMRQRYMVSKQLLDSIVFDIANFKETPKNNEKEENTNKVL